MTTTNTVATITTYTAQPFSASQALLGEGPVWDHRTNRLSWVDILRCELHVFDATTNITSVFRVPQRCGVQYLTFAIPCGPTQQPESLKATRLAPGVGAASSSVVASGAFTVPAVSACIDTFVCGTEKGLFLWNPFEEEEHHSATKEAKPTSNGGGGGRGKVLSLTPLLSSAAHRVVSSVVASKSSSSSSSPARVLLSQCPVAGGGRGGGGKSNPAASELTLPDGVRPNDAKVDAHGRLFYGTMDTAEKLPKGHLFRIATTTSSSDHPCTSHAFHGSLLSAEGTFTISNGIDWSPTYDVMYTIDSPTQQVYASQYNPETGLPLAGTKKVLLRTPEDSYPDGMCVDEEGFLWVALWNGGRVLRVHPRNGTVVAEVVVPGCKRVTSVCFGGPRLAQLFITTAIGNLKDAKPDAGEEKHAGRVYVAHVGACGQPMNPFPIPLPVAVQFCEQTYRDAVLAAKL